MLTLNGEFSDNIGTGTDWIVPLASAVIGGVVGALSKFWDKHQCEKEITKLQSEMDDLKSQLKTLQDDRDLKLKYETVIKVFQDKLGIKIDDFL